MGQMTYGGRKEHGYLMHGKERWGQKLVKANGDTEKENGPLETQHFRFSKKIEFSQGPCSQETGSAKTAALFRGVEETVSSQVEIDFLSAERTPFFLSLQQANESFLRNSQEGSVPFRTALYLSRPLGVGP